MMSILEEIQNCPVEWKELGEVALLKRGKTITSKTATEGPYPVISGGQKPAYFHGEFNREGETITVAGSGAYAGYVMYWDEPIFVSDAFSIEPLEGDLIPKFLYYYLLEKQETLFSLKKGSGVPHVYPKDVSKILIPIPPLEIQEKIVQILDKMTEYVTELTSELTSRKKQYTFYQDKLLSFEAEVYQVEWKTIQDISVKIVTGVTPKKSCEDYYLKGTIPWLRTNEVKFNTITTTEKYVTEKAVEETGLKWIVPNSIIIAISGATAGRVAMNSIPLTTNQHCCSISVDERIVNYKYLYYWLVNQNRQILSLKQGARGDINMSMIKSFKIPVPSLEIQSRIVQVLDNFDMVCNDLNIGLPKEIELRQKQYEYFREKLLTFLAEGEYTDSTVQYRQDIIRLLNWVFGPIRVELGVICNFIRGNGLQKKDFTTDGKPVIHYGQIYTKYDFSLDETLSKTSEVVFEKLKKAQPNDLVMATTSENVEDVGKAIVWEGKEEIGISGDSYIIQTSQNSRFLNYWLRSISFQSQKERKVTGTKVVRINSKDMEKFQIVIPSLTEQERIVSILDNFNTLTNSLSEGLPKEIELRQKQYEYWREQLLNLTR